MEGMFIYCVLYEVVNKFSFGLKYMNFRAASTFSLLTFTNALTFTKWVREDFIIYNNYWIVLFALIWLSMNLAYFGNDRNHLKIISRFKGRSIWVRFSYFIITGLYIGSTVKLFLMVV